MWGGGFYSKSNVKKNNSVYQCVTCPWYIKNKLRAVSCYSVLIHLGVLDWQPKMERPQFTPQQRSFMVTEYCRSNSATAVLRRFREVFPHVRCPTRATVYSKMRKYQETGSSHNQNQGRSGRRRTGRSAENIAAVREALEDHQDGTISSRRNGTGIPHATFNRITRLDLTLHPYQMIKRHKLLHGDRQRRLRFCQWLLQRPARFLDDFLIGDESGFALNAQVNTHNLRAYREKGHPPDEFQYERSDSRLKVTVWAGLTGNGDIIGPVFFDNNVTGAAYVQMIDEEVVPALNRIPRYRRRRNGHFQRVWWAQDGAPCHRSRAVTERLTQLFGDRVVSLHRDVEWPPRSPDLTPLDFFLWGYLKAKVYTTPPANLDEIRRITREMDELRRDRATVRRAVRDMTKRAQLCVKRGGGHVDHWTQ